MSLFVLSSNLHSFCRYVHGCLQSCSDADACNGAIGNNIRIHQSIASLFYTYLIRVWLTIVILWPKSFESLRSFLIVIACHLQGVYAQSKSISNHYQQKYKFLFENLQRNSGDSSENKNKDNGKCLSVKTIR